MVRKDGRAPKYKGKLKLTSFTLDERRSKTRDSARMLVLPAIPALRRLKETGKFRIILSHTRSRSACVT